MALATPIVFGNWKMHGLRAEADALAGGLADVRAGSTLAGTLGVFPPATVLARVAERLRGTGIVVGGQDCHQQPKGAFTGSVSAPMLKDAGAEAVIVGHSERRHGLGETDAVVRAKAEAALRARAPGRALRRRDRGGVAGRAHAGAALGPARGQPAARCRAPTGW